ncbi:MAG TPA: TAXI family TRAP transporter solute-binding subunit [Candidatus Eisenbacteria bacterium]|nr:TAXI family TRAP transporter solute-binding subunit [Candidatus Eisenbacteria bacterium]
MTTVGVAACQMTATKRYNSGIQRVKGLLELASGLYDGSLATASWKAAEGVLQTDTPIGNALKLSLTPRRDDRNGIALSFTTGGFDAIRAVAEGRFSLAWVNPSVSLTMAYRGKGPFAKPLPLRTIAVFPSYDVMGFAVHRSTGIASISQIKKERAALKLSIRRMDSASRKNDSTMFTVAEVLRVAGFTLEDIRRWGGEIHLARRPSDPARRAGIESGEVDAVFDEGIKSWARTALENGFRFLPVEGAILKHMTGLGYRSARMTQARVPGLPAEVQTLDFSGWPMIVRADMPDHVAYALCESIERRKDAIPTDNYKPLDIAQLCANDEEAPYDVPLHPGAARFYRERGYLK